MYDDGAGTELQGNVVGNIRRLEGVESPQLGNQRDVLVYLPPSYASSGRHYPVLYMQDGQNLFDERLAFAGEWGVDDTMDALSRAGLESIVVGIPNAGTARLDEYSPFRDHRHGSRGDGDAYLEFVTRTVKPLIDARFRTIPDREHTGIAGSSMGGLLSLYAFFRRPETFGFAGAFSPSLWFAARRIFPYVAGAPLVPGRLYLDIGTAEGRTAVVNARRMLDLLLRKGYRIGRNLLYVEECGARHSEAAWASRLPRALRFLLERPVALG